MRLSFAAPLALAVACAEGAPDLATRAAPVVYGQDDRKDWYDSESELFKRITREAIVALVPADRLDESDPTNIRLRTESLGRSLGLCADQRFREQPTGASCSGTLIDTDLVLTAGHCVPSLGACQSYRFVFDYYYESDGRLANIAAEDVYGCRQVVVAQSRGQVDFGVIQLDRPVSAGRRPVRIKAGDLPLTRGSSVAVVGFGSGIPAKIDLGGTVSDPRASERDYFLASTDTFEGHSGSGVFDHAGELIGVLVRGERDYVQRGSCVAVNTIDAPGGEGVTYSARARDALCPLWKTEVCGDTGGVCRACGDDGACPSGWSCARADLDPGVTWCAAPCASDTSCADGHVCDDGRCAPSVAQRCSAGDIWDFDTCGRRVGVSMRCPANTLCENAMCVSGAPGNSCDNALEIPLVDSTLEGELGQQFTNGYAGSCAPQNSGRDRVFAFDVDRRTEIVVEATGFDTVLYLREQCGDAATELACADDDDPPGNRGSHLEATLNPGRYYLFLDSFFTRTRAYRITIAVRHLEPPPVDAGFALDAVAADAGVAPDAEAEDAPASIPKSIDTVESGSGCGCRASSGADGGWALLLLLAFRRQRRS